MKSCLCIRHVAFEDLDLLGPVLDSQGFATRMVEAPVDPMDGLDPMAPDLLVVLGGPIGVGDGADYPFLGAEIELVRRRLAADRPTLGICLGAQVMAAALGGRVYPNPAGKEIGWAPVELTPEGEASPLDLVRDTAVLHWHGDTFDLPHGAVRLCSTPQTANQAFSWGMRGLALQFHIEVTPRGLERWYVGHAAEIGSVPGLTVAELRAQARTHGPHMAARGGAALGRWLAETCG